MVHELDESELDRFLDLACLTYGGLDRPPRRIEAAEILSDHPEFLTAGNVHVAAALGAAGLIEQCLHADPSTARLVGGPREWEPLLYLAYSRVSSAGATPEYVRSATLLLDHGANPNASFPLWGSTFTALTGLLGEGEQGPENQPEHPQADGLIALLLSSGAAPNDPQGAYNRMHRDGNDWLHTLLAHGLNAEDRINWDMCAGPRPRTLDFLLSHAVDSRYVDRIRVLLDHGADPSCRNPYNDRPVRTNALLNGSSDIAELLEDAGADAVAFSIPEQFRMAVRNRDGDEASRLVAAEPTCLDDVTLLRDAAQVGDSAAIEMLLGFGADINAADPGGVTPLHKAAENGHLITVKLLLSHGADPTLTDHNFTATPMGWAQHAGQIEAVKLLSDDRAAET